MFDPLAEGFKALGPWPIVQFAAALVLVYAGIKLIMRGEKDKKPANGNNGNGQPSWTLYGPAHDAMGAVHEMNEQSRNMVRLLERIEENLAACKITLELIRNESRLR